MVPIGNITSCFKENFGIPRQAGLVPAAKSQIVLPRALQQAIDGLEGFSHIWVLFLFHKLKHPAAKSQVRPPRLGGERSVGVFASRSPYRPNPIGMSAVKLEKVELGEDIVLHISGGDFLDGTPVLDIKPYLPYADAIPDAQAKWAQTAPSQCEVQILAKARDALDQWATEKSVSPHEKAAILSLLHQTVGQDPRPSHYRRRHPTGEKGRTWKMKVCDFDVSWVMEDGTCFVTDIERLRPITI